MTRIILLAFALCVCVHGHDTIVSTPPTFIRYLTNKWNGEVFAPNDTKPVIFSVQSSSDKKEVLVSFNSTVVTIKETAIPHVFGIMFKGERNAILQVEIHDVPSVRVEMFDGFTKQVFPKAPLTVIYNPEGQNDRTWNGSFSIPLAYFPRDTDSIAAYANFTGSRETTVLSLVTIKEANATFLPNLYRKDAFQEVDLHKELSNSQFAVEWSEIWRELLDLSPGGHPINETESSRQKQTNNDASLIEKGLITWIIASAVFCGILHVFVLAL